ncbi:MAG: DUF1499 domain-containing protein [Alphaproteobacteria bacterium]
MGATKEKGSTWLESAGLLGVALMVTGPLLAWRRVLPGLPGFGLYALGGLLVLAVAASTLVASARRRPWGFGRALTLPAAMVFIASMSGGFGAPRINDFTTDTADPPRLVRAMSLPANSGRDMAYPPDWATLQSACCADLRPARLAMAPAGAFASARAAAARMPGWEVVAVDEGSGTIEAIATTPLFGFQDDIAIRVRPDGDGSRVDVRSKSRDGKGDMGANADRIRQYVSVVETTR